MQRGKARSQLVIRGQFNWRQVWLPATYDGGLGTMVDFETAKWLLRALRREVKEVPNFGVAVEFRDQQFLVKHDDLSTYLERKPSLRKTAETQIWHSGYYERVVQFEGTGPRRPYRRSEDTLAMKSSDGTSIEIGRPSALFCISLTDVDEMDRELRRLTRSSLFPSGTENPSISDLFRLYTIKVSTAAENSMGKNATRMHELAEAAIFHFAYGKGVPITFTKSWERTSYWLGRKESESVQFPLRTYNSELVSYYNLALASDSLVLGYLALYKILEYFYTSASESALHEKIKEHLVAPDFVHTKPKKLRELVKAIRSFETHLDEVGALKLVLSTYFEKGDIQSWIVEYETKNGPYFTNEVDIFNKKMRLDLSDNTLIPNVALRIYRIRNALVHNKEGEIARFIPYTGQEEALHKEVQILVFLAEQLIIKTGKDIA
jgi:hypothetical protein